MVEVTGRTVRTPSVGTELIEMILGRLFSATMVGNDATPDENFHGTAGRNTIHGGLGDDWALGLGDRDLLTGGVGADTLSGGDADDTLYGDADNDLLAGGAGTDFLYGGSGDDLIFGDDSEDPLPVPSADADWDDLPRLLLNEYDELIETVMLAIEVIQLGLGFNAVDILDWAIGFVKDWLTDAFYEELSHQLFGAEGDNIDAGDGNDVVIGGDGNDVIAGGTGNDVLDGGAGADRVEGGFGDDLFYYDGLDTLIEQDGTHGGSDRVISSVSYILPTYFEILELRGDGALVGRANAAGNVLIGNAGASSLFGNIGNDVLIGDGDSAVGLLLDGGAGDDIYRAVTAADRIADSAGIDTVEAVDDYTLADFLEHLTLVGGALRATGNQLDNRLTGNALGNTLSGGAGNDSLYGGAGDDRFFGGYGRDRFYGGEGNDTVVSDANSALISSRYIEGGAGDDRLGGGGSADTIFGGTGNDTLRGHVADFHTGLTTPADASTTDPDSLEGGAGNDWIEGGGGADTLRGGEGNDTVWGQFEPQLTLPGPIAAAHDLIDLGAGDDRGVGSAGNDTIFGGRGADTIEAGDGVNQIDGGAGADQITTGSGADLVTGGSGADTISAGGGHDTLRGDTGSDLMDAGAGNDDISAGNGADTLIGGAGDDVYRLGLGSFTITELADGGRDLVIAAGSVVMGAHIEEVRLTEQTVAAQTGVAHREFFTEVIGNDQANSITGTASANSLSGQGGHDTLEGGGGSDTLLGGAGNDLITDAGAHEGWHMSPEVSLHQFDLQMTAYQGYQLGRSYMLASGEIVFEYSWDVLDSSGNWVNRVHAIGLAELNAYGPDYDFVTEITPENIGNDGVYDALGNLQLPVRNHVGGLIAGEGNANPYLVLRGLVGGDPRLGDWQLYEYNDIQNTRLRMVPDGVALRDISSDGLFGIGSDGNVYDLVGGEIIGQGAGVLSDGGVWAASSLGGLTITHVATGQSETIRLVPPEWSLNGPVTVTDISADGRYVALQSDATTLIPGIDPEARYPWRGLNQWIYDTATDTLRLVSARADGTPTGTPLAAGQSRSDSFGGVFSSDGRLMAFVSSSDALVAGDTNGRADVFVMELATGKIICVTQGTSGLPLTGATRWDAAEMFTDLRFSHHSLARDGMLLSFRAGNTLWQAQLTGIDFAQQSNDLLDGGAGADTMQGGAGNDTYVVDSAADVISDSAGNDLVIINSGLAVFPVDLDSYSGVENGTLEFNFAGNRAVVAYLSGTSGANILTGSAGANRITGEGGDDTIHGGYGLTNRDGSGADSNAYWQSVRDTLIGGAGNDVYFATRLSVIVEENGALGGVDRVHVIGDIPEQGPGQGVRLDLSDHIEQYYLEHDAHLDLGGSAAAHLVVMAGSGSFGMEGRGGADTLIGGSRADHLAGAWVDYTAAGSGNLYEATRDLLDGRGGDDVLYLQTGFAWGGEGNDHLTMRIAHELSMPVALNNMMFFDGGAGVDTLTLFEMGGRDEYWNGQPFTLLERYQFDRLASLTVQAWDNGRVVNRTVTDLIRIRDDAGRVLGYIDNVEYLRLSMREHVVVGAVDGLFAVAPTGIAFSPAGAEAYLNIHGARANLWQIGSLASAGSAVATLAAEDLNTPWGDSHSFRFVSGTGTAGAGERWLTAAQAEAAFTITGNVLRTDNFAALSNLIITDPDNDNPALVGVIWLQAVDAGGRLSAPIALRFNLLQRENLVWNLGDALHPRHLDLTESATSNDLVTGTAAANQIATADGNDTINGGGGADTIDAGGGNDNVLAVRSGDAIALDPVTGETRYTLAVGGVYRGGEGEDTITTGFGLAENHGFEVIRLQDYSGAALDLMRRLQEGFGPLVQIGGDAGANAVYGSALDDVVSGGAGHDTLDGRDGQDWLSGGEGHDSILGGNGNDSLGGDAGSDRIYAGAGDDSVSGGAGDDVLDGGSGANTLDGGTGSDTLTGGADGEAIDLVAGGADVIASGAGNDTISIWVGAGATPGSLSISDTGGRDELRIGVSAVAHIFGFVTHADGSRWYEPVITSYAYGVIDLGVSVSLNLAAFETLYVALVAARLTLSDRADALTVWQADRVDALGGNDTITATALDGRAGGTLAGGLGDDLYVLHREGDAAPGFTVLEQAGSGSDTVIADHSNFTLTEHVEFWTLTGDGAGVVTGSEAGDRVTITGQAAVDGAGGHDRIEAAAGHDTLVGGAGNDTLSGGAGDDAFAGGAGDDLIFGGAGAGDSYTLTMDRWQMRIETLASGDLVLTDLRAGAPEGSDTLSGIEFITIDGGRHALSAFTPSAADALWLGAPILEDWTRRLGNAGAAVSGFGADMPHVLNVTKIFDGMGSAWDLGALAVHDVNGVLGDTASFELTAATGWTTQHFRAPGSTVASRLLTASEAAALFTISGGRLQLRADADFSVLGNYSAGFAEVGIRVTDRDGRVSVMGVLVELAGVQRFVGTDGADTFTGFVGTETIFGGAGNDTLNGAGGDDVIDGGTGADRMLGGEGSDTFRVDDLGDRVMDTHEFDFDLIEASINWQLAGDGPDRLALIGAATEGAGAATDDAIYGNALDNRLYGGAGHDGLQGAAGADTLVGGAGNDVLTGGAGGDTAVYEALFDQVRVTAQGGGVYQIEDLRNATVPGFFGTDTLSGVEFLSLGGQVVAIEDAAAPSAPVLRLIGQATDGALVLGPGMMAGDVVGRVSVAFAGGLLPGVTLGLTRAGAAAFRLEGDLLVVQNPALIVAGASLGLTITANGAGQSSSLGLTLSVGQSPWQPASVAITGTASDDTLTGGVAPESLSGGAGNDLILDTGTVGAERTVLPSVATVSSGANGAALGGAVSAGVISGNGRWAAYVTTANTIGGGATGSADVVLRNLVTGETQVVTSAVAGSSQLAEISDTGRYVLFQTEAAGPGASAQGADLWLADLHTGTTRLVTSGATLQGGAGTTLGGGSNGEMSDSAGFVVFESASDHWLSSAQAAASMGSNIFLRDMASGRVTLVSANADGAIANASAQNAVISGDGRLIVYESAATNLGAATGGQLALWAYDRVSGTTTLVSQGIGIGNAASAGASVSDNGRFVAFESDATNLAGGLSGQRDIFVRDLVLGTTQLISTGLGGAGNGASRNASISGDGRFVAFESQAGNLTPNSVVGEWGVYLRDLWTGQVIRAPSSGAATGASLSDDGRWLAWLEAGELRRMEVRDLMQASAQDTLDGGAGHDTLSGGAGHDLLIGGTGNDLLEGGAGNDTLQGGEDIDRAIIAGPWTALSVTLSGGNATVSGAANGTDLLTGIETLSIGGLTGTLAQAVAQAASDISFVEDGAAMDFAAAGTRLGVLGATDANTAFGDQQSYSFVSASGGLTAAAADALFDLVAVGSGMELRLAQGASLAAYRGQQISFAIRVTGLDGLSRVETFTLDIAGGRNIAGTAGAESLTGTIGADTLNGAGGHDTLSGGAGDDLLIATIGNDLVLGGSGADTVLGAGNAGITRVSYGATWGDLRITLTADGTAFIIADQRAAGTAGHEGVDRLEGVSEIAFADGTLWQAGAGGIEAVNRLIGRAATDIAMSASSQITGQSGQTITTLSVSDTNAALGDRQSFAFVDAVGGLSAAQAAQAFRLIQTGDGTAQLASLPGIAAFRFGATVSVAVQVTGRDGLSYIETLVLAVNDAETLTGTAARDVLSGLSGHDTISGLGGDDTLEGGTGNDVLSGGDGTDRAVYATGWGALSVTDLGGGQWRVLDNRATSVPGHLGSDTLSGIETLEIGGNTGTLAQAVAQAASAITLSATGPLAGNAVTGAVVGSLSALDANDIFGEVQSFTFTDAAGGLTAAQAAALFRIDGTGASARLVYIGTGDLTLGAAAYQIGLRATGLDGLAYTQTVVVDVARGLTLTGTSAANALVGRGFDDRLLGLAGSDTLTGAGGNDVLDGGAGAADLAIYGGTWADTLVTRNADGSFTVTDTRASGTAGHTGTDMLRDVEQISIGGVVGDIGAAVRVAPHAITLSGRNISQTAAVGTTIGALTVSDLNTAFGDTATLSFVNAAGGLTAAQAGAMFRIVNGQLQVNSSNLLAHGNSVQVAIRATDRDGQSLTETVTITINRVNQHLPVGVYDGATASENAPLTLDLLANDSDADPLDALHVSQGTGFRPAITSVEILGQTITAATGTVTLRGIAFTGAQILNLVNAGLTVDAEGVLRFVTPAALDEVLVAGLSQLREDGVTLPTGMTLRGSYWAEDSFGARATTATSFTLSVIGADDIVTGTAGADLLRLATGSIVTATGNDTIIGSALRDVITMTSGTVQVLGGDGRDSIVLEAGVSGLVDGGAGNDDLVVYAGTTTVVGGAGNDFIQSAGQATLRYSGVAWADLLVGTNSITDMRASTVAGHHGTDTLPFTDLWLEIGGLRGRYADAIRHAASSIAVDAETVGDGAGQLVARLNAQDANLVFGDRQSWTFVDATGGAGRALTAAEAAAWFQITETGLGTAELRARIASVAGLADGPLRLAIQVTGTDGLSYTQTIDLSASLNNTVTGGLGNDSLPGGRGDDLILGLQGTDHVTFAGAWGDLRLTQETNGGVVVTDLRAGGAAGHSGTDTLSGIETVSLGGITGSLTDAVWQAASAMTISGTAFSDSAGHLVGVVTVADANTIFGDVQTLTFGSASGGLSAAQAAEWFEIIRVSETQFQLRAKVAGAALALASGAQISLIATGRDGLALEREFSLSPSLNNDVTGTAGADTMTGGAGDDTLDGAAGQDLARYEGGWADYRIEALEGGAYRITDLRAGSPEGTDILRNFEMIRYYSGMEGDPVALTDAIWQAASGLSLGAGVWGSFGTLAVHDLNVRAGEAQYQFVFRDAVGGLSAAEAAAAITIDTANMVYDVDNAQMRYAYDVSERALDQANGTLTFAVEVTGEDGLNTIRTLTRSGITLNNVVNLSGSAESYVNGAGNDTIFGRGGNDTLGLGRGRDVIYGGDGVDTLVINRAWEPGIVFSNGDGTWSVLDDDMSGFDTVSGFERALVNGVEVDFAALDPAAPLGPLQAHVDVEARAGALIGTFTFSDVNVAIGEGFTAYFRSDFSGTVDNGYRGVSYEEINRYFRLEVEGTTVRLYTRTADAQAFIGDGAFTVLTVGPPGTAFAGPGFTDGTAIYFDGVADNALTGGNAADTLDGRGGQDTILGLGGNDRLSGGADDDTMDGGLGTDTAVYDATWADLRITALAGGGFRVVDTRNATVPGHLGTDLLSGIERIALTGYEGLITAAVAQAATAITLSANAVNDGRGAVIGTLTATDANAAVGDSQSWTFANASGGLSAARAAELFRIVITGAGTAELRAIGAMTGLALGSPTTIAIRATGRDGLSLIQTFTLMPDDTNLLRGTSAADTLSGGIGNDTLQGLAGEDRLSGGAGHDTLTGGTETDTAIYATAWQDLQVVAVASGGYTVTDTRASTLAGHEGIDRLLEMEQIEIAGRRGNLADAVRQAASDIAFTSVTLTDVAGARLGTASATDANAVFGDVQSFAFANAAGGLSAARAAQLFHIVAGPNGTIEIVARNAGTALALDGGSTIALRVTGLDGLSRVETFAITAQTANLLEGSAGADTLTGGRGNDTILGGGGTDTAVFAQSWAQARVAASALGYTVTDIRASSVAGHQGTDQLAGVERLSFAGLTGTAAQAIAQSASAVAQSAGATPFEIARLSATDANTVFGDRQTWRFVDATSGLTAAQAEALFSLRSTGATTATILIDDGAVLPARTLTVAVQATGLDGQSLTRTITLTGTGGMMEQGTTRGEALIGGRGADTIAGFAGADTLTGGAGADDFVLNFSAADRITDFVTGTDQIWLEAADIAGARAGALAASAFRAHASGLASSAAHRLVYETDTGQLWYDADGTGAGARRLVGVLSAGLDLDAGDFRLF